VVAVEELTLLAVVEQVVLEKVKLLVLLIQHHL
jgi:hypothetical protein